MAANFLQQLPKLPNFGKFPVPGKLPGLYRPKKSIPEHQAMVQRQASMSLIAPHGLQNLTGENNCFLNSAIQVLWHIDVFRRSFRELEGHTCVGKSCIFCALKDLFTQFQHSQQTTIPPDVLRHALAECYREKHRFQLNLMDDAAECFEKLLEQVHFHLTGNDDLDSCGASFCISHQCFALNILERTECVCGATSEPLSFVQFVHYISSSALVKEAQKYLGPSEAHSPSDPPTNTESGRPRRNSATSTFGKILHAASSYGEYRECPNFAHCKKNVAVKRILLNCPDVVCLGLIWDSDQPPVDDIMAVVNNIGLTLQLSDVFDTVSAENAHFNEFQLTAAIAYYGRHYSTFCHHSRKREWIYFDDANFRTIGTEWSDVCEVIRKAHYQPLLLVYSNPFAEKIDTSQAPKDITRIFSHSRKKAAPSLVIENDATKEESSKTSSGEHTVISNSNAVSPTPQAEQKPIQNGSVNFDPTPVKSSTPVNPIKPPAPTEVINPMTFSIMPASMAHLAHGVENDKKSETTSKTSNSGSTSLLQDGGSTSANSNLANVRAQQPPGVEVSSGDEPVADLMMFSLTPSAIAQIRSTPGFNSSPGQQGQVMHTTTPASQPDLSKINEATPSTDDDLIEFSINPNLIKNAHSHSKTPYDFLSTTNQTSRSLSNSPLPPRARSPSMPSPELHTSRRSPELSRYFLKTDQQRAASPQSQEKSGETKNATNSTAIVEPQRAQKTPAPPFQRQTSFPFQNKQPAMLQSKTDIHALPQSSDFANRFPALDKSETSKVDQLKPNWEHFAESEKTSSSEFFSTSPEKWTVLTATGEEEATFKPQRQFSEDFVSTMTTSTSESDDRTVSSEVTDEEIKHTPAITSLKRVANYVPEKPKPVSPVAGRPLPSVPNGDSSQATTASQPTALPLSDNERGLPPSSLGSPMAHLSPNGTTAKFLAHPNLPHTSNALPSRTSRPNAPPSTKKSTYDPVYADPDDLVFCKPNSSEQLTARSSQYGQKHHQDVTSKSKTQIGKSSGDGHEYYVEVETVAYKSPEKAANSQPGSTRDSAKDGQSSNSSKSSGDGRKSASGGSAADEFSSPPITADPLYALPEKLKIKFASQGATTTASSTTTENRASPPIDTSLSSLASPTSSIGSSAAGAPGSVGGRSSKPATTGSEYLTLLLQERQSARQQTSANLTTPTGDLLEASTKVRAGSNIDLSPTTVSGDTTMISIGNSTISTASLKTKHRSGKEYLAELLQRRAKQQQSAAAQSSSVGLGAEQTPKYTMPSNSSSASSSSNPRYTAASRVGLGVGQTPKYAASSNSSSASSSSNPRYTTASESRFSQSQSAYTEKQPSTASRTRNTVQPSYHSSRPGIPSSGAVSSGRNVGEGNVQRVGRVTDTAAHIREVTSQGKFVAQKKTPTPAVMPAIPGHIHSRLLEARDLWAKAEASLPTDTAVAYMLFSQHNGILASVLQDPAVKANAPLHQHVSNIKGEGSKRAAALKLSITSTTPTATTRSSPEACQRCGNIRNLDSNNLCGPCQLRAQIGK